MKDYIHQLLEGVSNPVLARCVAREYLQARILQCFQDRGVFTNWAFQGGTALRFLFGIPRFSEDLDFSLVDLGIENSFKETITDVKTMFEREDYAISVKVNEAKVVKSAFIRMSGILYELGLSPLPAENLSIKVEIDTNPPAGAKFESTVIRRYVMLNIRHHDKSSLLAGKLHAVLARQYVKGRDVYDLLWYLSDRSWPQPNLVLLSNALEQTKWSGPTITPQNWKSIVLSRAEEFNWDEVVADVKPFFERPEDTQFLNKETLLSLLMAP